MKALVRVQGSIAEPALIGEKDRRADDAAADRARWRSRNSKTRGKCTAKGMALRGIDFFVGAEEFVWELQNWSLGG
jgi:hypothetical protein